MKDVYVIWNGKKIFRLNEQLLTRQNVWHNLEKIKQVHQTKLDIFQMITEESDPSILKDLANDITLCEYELQRLWGFPEDHKFHRFWLTPKCQCPRMDNEDNYGTGYYVIVHNCPLHGGWQ